MMWEGGMVPRSTEATASAPPKVRTTFDWLSRVNPNLPEGDPKTMAEAFAAWATYIQNHLPEGAEKATALRKLLEAKDCAVRALLQTT